MPKVGRVLSQTQLAPGTSRGARHVVEGDVVIYAPLEPDALMGPVIDARGRIVITHPEHAHFALPPGIYQVSYQRDFTVEEVSRVED